MAKAKKLPSGRWRCLAYSHTDENGKRHYESFTADSKKEAEYLAAEFLNNKDKKVRPENYITIKTNVLSPSTIRTYNSIYRSHIKNNDIGKISLREVSNVNVQKWVGYLSGFLKPQTVRKVYTLMYVTISMFLPDLRIKVTLPKGKEPNLYVPSDDDVKRLLEHVRGKELEIAILLAAFGPMRRGEICALESSDIHGNLVTVNKSMVLTASRDWIIKQPKTMSSYRTIEFPQSVIDRMKGIEGRIVKATPGQITNRFQRAIRFSHLREFRFHDLRHYSASIMHAMGIADQYIMERGGWASDRVMKKIYIGTIEAEKKKATEKILEYFDGMQHEIQQ